MKEKLYIIIAVSLFSSSLLLGQIGGIVEHHSFFSQELGVTKYYYVYLPVGYHHTSLSYPVVYFLRLHEDEWFDPNWHGRIGTSLEDVANSLIVSGQIGKMILIAPSTGSSSYEPGLVNMLRPDLATGAGIGSGLFEDYVVTDLIAHIDSTYRTIPDRDHRGVDGFSYGGYSSTLLGIKHPELFCSVGSYDGTIMWYNLDDPTTPGMSPDDGIWMVYPEIDLIFDNPRNVNYMLSHSAINILVAASPGKLDSIRSIAFHLHSGFSDDIWVSNKLRNMQLLDSMSVRGIHNSFQDLVLDPNAIHDFFWADKHAEESLIKHWEKFGVVQVHCLKGSVEPYIVKLFTDTVRVLADIWNIPQHQVLVKALITNLDSTFQDSIPLFDDGQHGDSLMGDNLYGGYIPQVQLEDEFLVGIKTVDLDTTYNDLIPEIGRFTSIGPVVLDSLIAYDGYKIGPFYRIPFIIVLRNNGLVTTARNISALLSTTHPGVAGIDNNPQDFGDIPAGQTVESPDSFIIRLQNPQKIENIPLYLDFYSDGMLSWRDSTNVVVGIRHSDEMVPIAYQLKQNFPNPFNPSTTIEFDLPKTSEVTLKVFNILGEEVATLVSDRLAAGSYSYEWSRTGGIASGVYLYRLQAGNYVETRKMVLMR